MPFTMNDQSNDLSFLFLLLTQLLIFNGQGTKGTLLTDWSGSLLVVIAGLDPCVYIVFQHGNFNKVLYFRQRIFS